ncbi:hypothetical protein LINGRAHAP2_LOCUS28097 [Linum grandiflorum]
MVIVYIWVFILFMLGIVVCRCTFCMTCLWFPSLRPQPEGDALIPPLTNTNRQSQKPVWAISKNSFSI